jgi:glutamine amidotransferase-like uncharacterized protein
MQQLKYGPFFFYGEIMSGMVVIYDKVGVSPFCSSLTRNQIHMLIDDRKYSVQLFSETTFDDSKPVPLFVVPGGSYMEMEKELKAHADSIRKLVLGGGSYLGICAGAIAASCHPLLLAEETLRLSESDSKTQRLFSSGIPTHLRLYSGFCALAEFPGSSLYGVQEARTEGGASSPFFFKNGVFFPNLARQLNACRLLSYQSLNYSWEYPAPPYRFLDETPSVAALTQRVLDGRIVLSGLHPEIGAESVETFPVEKSQEQDAKVRTIDALRGSEAHRNQTMRLFLQTLGIATK